MRVIMSVDSNPVYTRHLPLVRSAWNRLGYSVKIVGVERGIAGVDEEMLLDGIPSNHAAMIARILAACNDDGRVMLSDVDMIPLSKVPFYSALKGLMPGTMLALGGDAYNVGHFYPICYLLADSNVWRSVVNPRGKTTGDLVSSWVNAGIIGGHEFSDEALLKMLIDAWGGKVGVAPRHSWRRSQPLQRLDREHWDKCDPDDVSAGVIWDAHLPRGNEDISVIERAVLG